MRLSRYFLNFKIEQKKIPVTDAGLSPDKINTAQNCVALTLFKKKSWKSVMRYRTD